MIDQKLIIENPTLIQEKLAKKENLEIYIQIVMVSYDYVVHLLRIYRLFI